MPYEVIGTMLASESASKVIDMQMSKMIRNPISRPSAEQTGDDPCKDTRRIMQIQVHSQKRNQTCKHPCRHSQLSERIRIHQHENSRKRK